MTMDTGCLQTKDKKLLPFHILFANVEKRVRSIHSVCRFSHPFTHAWSLAGSWLCSKRGDVLRRSRTLKFQSISSTKLKKESAEKSQRPGRLIWREPFEGVRF